MKIKYETLQKIGVILLVAILGTWLLSLAIITDAQTPTTDYMKWIGPTWDPSNDPIPTIDNPAFNNTLGGMGINSSDIPNSSINNFDGPSMIGGLTTMFTDIGPLVVIFFGIIIAYIAYVKYDGSLLVPGLTFIATGFIGGGMSISFGFPVEMSIFCVFVIILGVAGAMFEAVVSR